MVKFLYSKINYKVYSNYIAMHDFYVGNKVRPKFAESPPKMLVKV